MPLFHATVLFIIMSPMLSPNKAAFALTAVFALLVSSSIADPSEACLNETAMVQSGEGVMSAWDEMLSGQLVVTPPLTCSSGSGSTTCTYDFTTAQTDFKAACTAAGGQTVMTSFTITCDVTQPNTTTPTEESFLFTSTPSCIGASCDAADAQDLSKGLADNITSALDEFNYVDDCAVSVSSAPTIRGAATFLLISGALLACVVVF